MTLKTLGLTQRHCAELVRESLTFFPCVSLIGSRQSGKTTLLRELGPEWSHFDLEKRVDYEVIARDPDLFFRLHPANVAIDEAQTFPPLFQALRVAVDADRSKKGRFVLTGSSSPSLSRAISERLAGRIGQIEMSPFSLGEALGLPPSPFFAGLADRWSARQFAQEVVPRCSIAKLHDYWLWGGYPEPWVAGSTRFRKSWMEHFVRHYLDRDIGALFPRLNRIRFRRFLQLLAGLSGTILNYSDVARTLDVSQPTAREYFEIAHGSFLWRTIPAFARASLKRAAKRPRGYLRDSGLLHHLLRVDRVDDLLGHPQMGLSWQSMVVEQILRGLDSRGTSYDCFHYRTNDGAAVDLVLDGAFGLVPIEVKHGESARMRDLRSLRDFMVRHDCRIGFVMNNDAVPRLYGENVVGLPAACL